MTRKKIEDILKKTKRIKKKIEETKQENQQQPTATRKPTTG